MAPRTLSSIALAIILPFQLLLYAAAAPAESTENLWTYQENIEIPTLLEPENPESSAAITLPANLHVPSNTPAGQLIPAVIFISGWGSDEHENSLMAQLLASRGYIVLRYTNRGFHAAGGNIDMAGNRDVADAASAITFVLANTAADPARIAIAGNSYGAGIALTTAFRDERVTAVIARNGWGDLNVALRPAGTSKDRWIRRMILGSNPPVGQRDPTFMPMMEDIYHYRNHNDVAAWLEERSPLHYLDQVHQRENPPALYIANNLQDYFFTPNTLIPLLREYRGPWHVDFIGGAHGQDNIDADKPLENPVIKNAVAWLDHFLKGEKTYIDIVDRVSTRVKSPTGRILDTFPRFPVQDATVRFFAAPKPGDQGGTLEATPTGESDIPVIHTAFDTVWTGGNRGAAMMSSRYYRVEDIDRRGAIVFLSAPLQNPMYLRGSATVDFSAYVADGERYFAYLLDYNPETLLASWVGHGPFTWRTAVGQADTPDTPQAIHLEMYWTAHDVAPGHQLVLVIDGADPEYQHYVDSPPLRRFVIDPEHPMRLTIPVIHERKVPDTIDRRAALAEAEAEGPDNDRGLNGQGTRYGPGAGRLNAACLLVMGLWMVWRVRALQHYRYAAR